MVHEERVAYLRNEFRITTIYNPRTYMQTHTPTVVQEGGGAWLEPHVTRMTRTSRKGSFSTRTSEEYWTTL